MGWPQTRDAPTERDDNAIESDGGIENPSMPLPFATHTAPRAVFVINDELLRHGLIHVMAQGVGVAVVGDLPHGPGLPEQLLGLAPQLLVVDAEMGHVLPTLLAGLDPIPRVVAVIDGADPRERALPMITAGADGVIDRRSSPAELRRAVVRVIDGHRALDARSAETLVDELRRQSEARVPVTLTRREREVLDLVVEGLDNRAVAGSLFISEATVKFHLHNIKTKFDVRSRAALVATVLKAHDRA